MPQSERSAIIKEMLKWLSQFKKGQTLAAIVTYTKCEITELGATNATIKKYVQDLHHARFIECSRDNPFWKVTDYGNAWLERHTV